MTVTPLSDDTFVSYPRSCQLCCEDGEEYEYQLGPTCGTVVLCDRCVQTERLRCGRDTLVRVDDSNRDDRTHEGQNRLEWANP